MNRRLTRRTVLNGLGSSAVLAATGAAMVARSSAARAALPAWQAGAPDEWRRILAEARKEGQVTVAGFPALGRTMPAAFKRDTGIELKFFGGRPSDLSSRFEAEALANKMTLDIMLGGGRELVKMKPGGFLNPVRPQLILPGVGSENYRDGELKFMDDDDQYLLQGAEWVFGWLLVNKDIVDPGKIKVWKDMLKPEFRGKMISHDPRSPGPGQGATNWLYNTFGIEFVKAFYLGQQAKFTTSNRGVVEEGGARHEAHRLRVHPVLRREVPQGRHQEPRRGAARGRAGLRDRRLLGPQAGQERAASQRGPGLHQLVCQPARSGGL